MDMLEPRDEADLVEIVAAALANETPLEIIGNGTKRGLGRPVEVGGGVAGKTVTTRALSGVTMYEPAELCMTARAGTPMREIINQLDQNGQELAFEPIDYHRLYGGEVLGGTIGGLFGVNASGPRRIRTGAARDHLLGFRAVSGRGEVYKSGGRVMKNVTGYDLSKLITGSYGTLGIMSEVTFKVMPKAETEQTLIIVGLEDTAGLALLCNATGLPYDISGFAHLPPGALNSGADWNSAAGVDARNSITALRLEGPDISVADRQKSLTAHFKSCGGVFVDLDPLASAAFWVECRDAAAVADHDGQVWRISTAPGNGAELVGALHAIGLPFVRSFYDWAGGLIWLSLEQAGDAHATAIRAALAPFGGHATLIRASEEVRSRVGVFQPQPKALAALSARVAKSFDPRGILNRGRLVAYSGDGQAVGGPEFANEGNPVQ